MRSGTKLPQALCPWAIIKNARTSSVDLVRDAEVNRRLEIRGDPEWQHEI